MDQQKIGKYILDCRRKKQLTQQELAEKLGVSDRTIGNWGNGRNLPDISLYKPLCEILEISLEELINGEKTNKNNLKESYEKAINNTINSNQKIYSQQMLKTPIKNP